MIGDVLQDGRTDLGWIDNGAGWTGTFTWTDSAGAPVNVTGYTSQARLGAAGGQAVVTLNVGTGITLGGAAGTITVTLTAAQTALVGREAHLDVDVTSGSGASTAITRGTLERRSRVEP